MHSFHFASILMAFNVLKWQKKRKLIAVNVNQTQFRNYLDFFHFHSDLIINV